LHDISFGLVGGPTDCEARLRLMRTWTPGHSRIPAVRSRNNRRGIACAERMTPLKTSCARLSQVAVVEHAVDHRRRVAWLRAADVGVANAEAVGVGVD
jgi:hypothetical protein